MNIYRRTAALSVVSLVIAALALSACGSNGDSTTATAAAGTGGETVMTASVDGAGGDDAGEVLAGRIIELMRATGMPNGLSALGLGSSHVTALAQGAEPQYRVMKNAPIDVGHGELRSLFEAAMRYW